MSETQTPTPAPAIPGPGTLADFRNQFLDWLNRGDISVQQADRIIQRAIGRLNLELRVPYMEKDIDFTLTNGQTLNRFALPDDFLEFQTCVVDGVSAIPTTYERWLTLPANPGRGAQFARDGGSVVCKPAASSTFRAKYYGAFAMVTNDGDTCLAFTQVPELLLWASLAAAGDMFDLTDQQAKWEASYQRELATLNQIAQRVDRLGGTTTVGPVKGYAV